MPDSRTRRARRAGPVDQQIVAAELRRDIAEKDLAVHDVQIDNAEKVSKTLSERYTNDQLYQWMVNETTSVYYRAYKLAFDTAKQGRALLPARTRHIRHLPGLRLLGQPQEGAAIANKLLHDIKRMEARYLDIQPAANTS